MDNTSYQQPEMEINLKELIWDLLEQWKAVLVVALLTAIIVAGARYYKDIKAYNTVMSTKEEASQLGKTAEERISDVLASLPEGEVATVEFMINQSEWMNTEKEYMNKSILMNTNPTNQRTMMLDYYISMSDASEAKMAALVYGYAGYLKDESLLSNVGEIIAPDAEQKYIAELISSNVDMNGTGAPMIDSDADGAIVEVRIVLPDNADATSVETAMTSSLSKYTTELKNKIGNHSINLINSTEAHIFNASAVNNHNIIMTTIYNLQSNEKNMQAALTGSQRAAIDSIKAIKREAKESVATEQGGKQSKESSYEVMQKPGINKKYTLLGFMLGVIGYGFTYLLLLIIKGRINTVNDALRYSQTRLIGEIYQKQDCKGLCKLLHSNLVCKYRYGNKTDADNQINNTVDALEAVCKQEGLQEVAIISTAEDREGLITEIIDKTKEKNIETRLIKVLDTVNIKELSSLTHAVLFTDTETKISKLAELVTACKDYDVSVVGNVFARDI